MSTTETLLQQGVVAARAGRRDEARELLMQVVQADERSEAGWLWLAGVVDDPEDMRTCLENVLDLNPGNVKAQQGLAWIDARYGPRQASEPAPTPEAPPPEDDDPEPEAASYTGPTTRLAPEPEISAPAAPKPQPAPAEQAPPEAAPPENPCPYCGAPTQLSQEHCTQCRNSLMIRTPPREQRSLPVTILAWLWIVTGVLTLLSGIFLSIGLFAPQGRGGAAASARGGLLGAVIGAALGGLLYLTIGRGLLRRARWAYIVHCILTVLSVAVALLQLLAGGALLAGLSAAISAQRSPQGAQIANIAGTIVGVALFCLVLWTALYILLTVLGYHDFYGRRVRFQPTLEPADHMGHYNNGVAYKNRGMWYMAAREWEVAVSKAPRDLNYLHALGLAYAQTKQFARARATLDTALSLAPADPRLQESRALVDRMAEQKR